MTETASKHSKLVFNSSETDNLEIVMLNWDDLNFFRSIAPERSFRRAAARHNLSVNTIRSRIDRLEKALGMTLFQRSRDGLSLSIEGMTALDIVLEMDSAIGRLAHRPNASQSYGSNVLTLCCTDGIAEFLLAPRLPALIEVIEGNVSIHCDSDQDRIHSTERDVCIGFSRPTNPETIVCKLASISFALCASKAYLERFGRPESLGDLDGHRFIVQESYGLDAAAMRRIFGNERASRLVAAKTNSSKVLCQAVASGFGIGALPNYFRGRNAAIEALDLPIALTSDLWMSFNRMSMNSQAKRNAIDWIKDCLRQMDASLPAEGQLVSLETEEGHLRQDSERTSGSISKLFAN